MAMMQKNMEFFFSRYRPGMAALKTAGCRLVPAAGSDPGGQLAHRGALGMARLLGVEPAIFPVDHGGFDGRPDEFAEQLLEVLHG